VPSLRTEVVRVGDRLLLRLSGELRRSNVARLRTVLVKCLAEQPAVLVTDLTGLAVPEPVVLAVFAAVARQAETWPGASMMLCTADPEVSRLLATGAFGRLPVFAGAAEALAAEPARGMPSLSDVLLPTSGAVRHARALAAEVCDRWDLPRLEPAVVVVANELVGNAVTHARTMMDLRFSRGRHYVLIAVRDGSDSPPRLVRGPSASPAAGRGLLLVDGLTRLWGSFPAAGGKVVWAALSAREGGRTGPPSAAEYSG
jgi:anti-anti-sigma factor